MERRRIMKLVDERKHERKNGIAKMKDGKEKKKELMVHFIMLRQIYFS